MRKKNIQNQVGKIIFQMKMSKKRKIKIKKKKIKKVIKKKKNQKKIKKQALHFYKLHLILK